MKKIDRYNTLGVINRTPNSFSDSGKSLNKDYFLKQITEFLEYKNLILDIGFESTASMNRPISSSEELKRFFEFLELTKSFDFSDRYLSFDTYKPQSFLTMAKETKRIHPHVKFIFNDVSGVLDLELASCLKEISNGKTINKSEFYYVYSFTHVPQRALTLNHMNYLDESRSIVNQCLDSFKEAQAFFIKNEMIDSLIFDPGFGFSKTFEQNWGLIHEFSLLDRLMAQNGLNQSMLVGLSKKSFLKKSLEVTQGELTEGLHQRILQKMNQTTRRHLLFRVHNPQVINF